ncbi:lipopolysaccharide biosynthesis protein [Parabacteroides bouchesdurhonensis]|uniref:lipopolysaccharide biosynthesis protein n=1 Tax=Parabacteroides bouchesdurhonensis TaxID=1936995 RepID=UPI000E5444C7|nr:oligosaccharide flippase family protein [Parabacteroides bouchesdurhonensis]RHJ94092.1 lipopolysaccharide biosynthesis protein [Bacteroides sp. AM07-16]
MAQGMKRLAKETAVYGVSSILGRFLNWMLVPMYTRVLASTADFGIVTNIYGWIALLLVLLTYGMETGFFRFINKKEEQQPMRIYSTALFSLGISSLAFILLLFPFHGIISQSLGYAHRSEYILMMGITVAIDAFCCIPFAYLRYKGRAIRFAFIKLLNIFLNIALNIFFLIACPWLQQHHPETVDWFFRPDYSVGYIFISNVITTAITFILLVPDMMPGLREKPNLKVWSKMLRYSFPILILGIAGIFNQTADKILFPFLFEDKVYANEQLGIYGACFKIALVMVMFTQAFRYAYEPFIFAKNKEEGSKKAYSEAMKYFIIFTLFIFLFVMFYIDIFKYFVDQSYYPGLRVVPIVMLGELFFGVYFNLSFWYKLIDQTQWGAYFSTTGCVITVSIILLFGPTYGYMACAWASFCCNLLMMLLSYFVGQKKFPIQYDLKSAFIYASIAAILYLAGMLPKIDSEIIRLVYRSILLLIFIAFTVRRDLPLRELPYIGKYFR